MMGHHHPAAAAHAQGAASAVAEEPHTWPGRPLTAEEVARHERLVGEGVRAPTVEPASRPATAQAEFLESNGALPLYSATDSRTLSHGILLRGDGHRVLFTIDELESPDAIEQMVEEMADEHMTWHSAYDTVAKLRRGWYNSNGAGGGGIDRSRAANRRRGEGNGQGGGGGETISLASRLWEYLELSSLYDPSARRLIPEHVLEMGQPPGMTNYAYWGIRKMADCEQWVQRETHYLAQQPDVVGELFRLFPWLVERGYPTSAQNALLAFVAIQNPNHWESLSAGFAGVTADTADTTADTDALTQRMGAVQIGPTSSSTSSEQAAQGQQREASATTTPATPTTPTALPDVRGKTGMEIQALADRWFPRILARPRPVLTWIASRKPGVVLPERPRQIFARPQFRPDKCPCCGGLE